MIPVVPQLPVLLRQQQDRAVGARPARSARVLQQHEGEQSRDRGLVGHERVEQPAQPDRLVDERAPHRGLPRAGRVALVEHQVDGRQDAGQPCGQLVVRRAPGRGCAPAGSSAWPASGAWPSSPRAPGAPARPRPWSGRPASAGSGPPGPRATRLGWQQVKTRRSRSSRTTEADRLGSIVVEERHRGRLLRPSRGVAADAVDRAAARDDGEPGARLVGDAVARPRADSARTTASCTASCGEVDVAGDADEGGEDARVLLADRTLGRVIRRRRASSSHDRDDGTDLDGTVPGRRDASPPRRWPRRGRRTRGGRSR